MAQSVTGLNGDNNGIESQQRQRHSSCRTTHSGFGPHPTFYPMGTMGSLLHNTISGNTRKADHSPQCGVMTKSVTFLPRVFIFPCLEFSTWHKLHFKSGHKWSFYNFESTKNSQLLSLRQWGSLSSGIGNNLVWNRYDSTLAFVW
jgi:hypothetical protein